MNELQYQDVSTYLRAWYKGKKNDSPIELGSDLGLTTLPVFLKHSRLVLDTYKAAVHVCRGLSAEEV